MDPIPIVVLRESEETSTTGRSPTSNELHGAIEGGELELHYQPQVDLPTRTLAGIEAFVRWRHPTRGLLLPGEFLPLAEDSGVIVPLGAWVVAEACRQTAEWRVARTGAGQEGARLNVSVNVSAQQIADPRFPHQVAQSLEQSGIEPDKLWIEITERTLSGSGDALVDTLNVLRGQGIHLQIDDFGTGYSSLSDLKRLPIESLKIDPSFIDDLDRNSEAVAIVGAVLALGRSLGLSVLAKGVERLTQADQLQALDCPLAQGYFFGVPLSAAALDPHPTDDLTSWQRRLGPGPEVRPPTGTVAAFRAPPASARSATALLMSTPPRGWA
jgi:EAL domain-containing protein (putative c-di-GMP-specific phosphodiesterase class I)